MASHVGTGWEDQWDRVRRWYRRVQVVASGAAPANVLPYPEMGGPDLYRASALDLIYTFFMNCYHLRDWLILSGRDQVDDYIETKDALVWCRDICNGMKHCRLDPKRKSTTYQSWTTATESAVYVNGEPVSRAEPVPGKHWVFVDPASGERRDMFELARACMVDWAAFVGRQAPAEAHPEEQR